MSTIKPTKDNYLRLKLQPGYKSRIWDHEHKVRAVLGKGHAVNETINGLGYNERAMSNRIRFYVGHLPDTIIGGLSGDQLNVGGTARRGAFYTPFPLGRTGEDALKFIEAVVEYNILFNKGFFPSDRIINH